MKKKALPLSFFFSVRMQTYTSAFSADAPTVTTHDIANLCQFVEDRLGPGYRVIPASVSEGGLEFTAWPDAPVPPPQPEYADYGTHKSIRFRFQMSAGKWPWMADPDHVRAIWKSEPAQIIWYGGRCDTVIKAFGNAPQWTPHELSAVRDGLISIGWKCAVIPAAIKYNHRAV